MLEADARGELGIGVERVEISREAVEERLLLGRGLFHAKVRRAVLGDFDVRLPVVLGRSVAPEAPGVAHDDRPRGVEEQRAGIALGLGIDDDGGEATQVVDAADLGGRVERAGGRNGRMHADALAAVDDHGEIGVGLGE